MKRLIDAPHRLYFLLGALASMSLFVWWWSALQNTHAYNNISLHALLMPLGVFPLFILGFTFTAGPRWLNVNASDQLFLLNGGTYFSGLMLVLLATISELIPLRSAGFALMLCAWIITTLRWAQLIQVSKVTDKRHAQSLLLAMAGGVIALIATLFWSSGWNAAWSWARQLAFYIFLLPIFLTVCHRMLPFFTGNILTPYLTFRPYWLLYLWIIACWMLASASIAGSKISEGIIAGALSASFMMTSLRWGVLRCHSNRLLAMLHYAFAWLIIVFLLQAISAFGTPIGSAPIHALALGFMSTMLVAFVSRVSFGHSGRPLQVNNLLWSVYLGLHFAALLRVLGSVLGSTMLISISASAWLLLLGVWVALMLPIYLRARVDGEAG